MLRIGHTRNPTSCAFQGMLVIERRNLLFETKQSSPVVVSSVRSTTSTSVSSFHGRLVKPPESDRWHHLRLRQRLPLRKQGLFRPAGIIKLDALYLDQAFDYGHEHSFAMITPSLQLPSAKSHDVSKRNDGFRLVQPTTSLNQGMNLRLKPNVERAKLDATRSAKKTSTLFFHQREGRCK
jgi:hypothetical protein